MGQLCRMSIMCSTASQAS